MVKQCPEDKKKNTATLVAIIRPLVSQYIRTCTLPSPDDLLNHPVQIGMPFY